MGDTRFVRIHGRIVPIHTGSGAKSANMAEGKKQLTKAGTGLKKQAIHKANDVYNHDLNPKQQQAVKSGFKIADTMGQGASLAAGAAAFVGSVKLGQLGMKAVDHGIDSYSKKATDARKEYRNSGIIGGALAGMWGGLAAIDHSLIKKNTPGLAVAKKFGTPSSDLAAVKIGKQLKRLKFGRNFSLAMAGISVASTAIGAIGYSKAKKHEQRAAKLKEISTQVKQFVGSK